MVGVMKMHMYICIRSANHKQQSRKVMFFEEIKYVYVELQCGRTD